MDCDKPSAALRRAPLRLRPARAGLARAGGAQLASGALAGDRAAHPQLPPAAPQPPAPLPGGPRPHHPDRRPLSLPARPLLRERRRQRLEPTGERRPADDHRRQQAERAHRPEQEPPQRDPPRPRARPLVGWSPSGCAAARCGCARGARWCSRRRSTGSSAATCSRSRRALRSDVRHLGYNALVGGELVVARGPRAATPSRLVRRSVWQQGRISPINGTNCTPGAVPVRDPQGRRRQGASRRPRQRRRAGGAIRQPRHPHEAEAGRPRARRPAAAALAAGSRSAPTSRRARA